MCPPYAFIPIAKFSLSSWVNLDYFEKHIPKLWKKLMILYKSLNSQREINIMSRCSPRFPWFSLAIHPYHTPLLSGPFDYTLCSYRAVENKFLSIGQHLRVHFKWCIGKWHVSVNPYYSSSVPRVLLVLFWWFQRWNVRGGTVAVLWHVVSRICSV